MNKQIIITDPRPRTLELIFRNKTLKKLKKKYLLVKVPKKNKKNFYEKNIHRATFIIGQPNLPTSLLIKAVKLKAIFNVESNFIQNMDYDYCFKNNIYVLSTSPVFAQPVAELALGLTLSLLRQIHESHQSFKDKNEKYGLEGNKRAQLLNGKKIGLIGFGDLAKSLLPLIKPFTNKIYVYDPWLSNKLIKKKGLFPVSLNNLLKNSDVIYVLATSTTKNKEFLNIKKLNLIKKGGFFILMSRASLVKFSDLIKKIKKGDLNVAIDVFPNEPVSLNDPIRKLENVVFSAHRAGAIAETFKNMGEIVLNDMEKISKNLSPKFCKRANLQTVNLLRSKPVDIS